jgi:predicted  nucleic acid-binding Zn-ribbon protein
MRGPAATRERAVTHSAAHVQIDDERIARLENELSALQNEVADLKQQLAAFRKQFE